MHSGSSHFEFWGMQARHFACDTLWCRSVFICLLSWRTFGRKRKLHFIWNAHCLHPDVCFPNRMLVLRGTTKNVPLFISQERGIFEGEFVNCKNKVFSSFISLETRYVVGPTSIYVLHVFMIKEWTTHWKTECIYFFFINLHISLPAHEIFEFTVLLYNLCEF